MKANWITRFAIGASIVFLSLPSFGFQILSAITEPCHEQITLGILGQGSSAVPTF